MRVGWEYEYVFAWGNISVSGRNPTEDSCFEVQINTHKWQCILNRQYRRGQSHILNEMGFMPSFFYFYHTLTFFLSVCHSRDVDGRMLLDIFDEKLHPLSVRPELKINFHYAQAVELSGVISKTNHTSWWTANKPTWIKSGENCLVISRAIWISQMYFQ